MVGGIGDLGDNGLAHTKAEWLGALDRTSVGGLWGLSSAGPKSSPASDRVAQPVRDPVPWVPAGNRHRPGPLGLWHPCRTHLPCEVQGHLAAATRCSIVFRPSVCTGNVNKCVVRPPHLPPPTRRVPLLTLPAFLSLHRSKKDFRESQFSLSYHKG